jgi:predicted DNA-binding transcriptional regulator YafY
VLKGGEWIVGVVAFCLQRSCKTSKYDRLLYILNLLRSRNTLRAADLAKEREVSERIIYQDISDLSSANISVYLDDEYKLLTDAFFPPLNFDLDDYLTLKLALESSPLSLQSPLRRSAKRVLTKIDTDLSSGLKAKLSEISAEDEKEPIKVDVKSTSEFSKFSLWFNLREQGIVHNKTVNIFYKSLDSGETFREVDPYFLAFRKHAWYLVGFYHLRNEIRVFRINRIKPLKGKKISKLLNPSEIAGRFIRGSQQKWRLSSEGKQLR